MRTLTDIARFCKLVRSCSALCYSYAVDPHQFHWRRDRQAPFEGRVRRVRLFQDDRGPVL